MQGICVEASNTTNLVVGETYYLFPHGGSAYYVSRFLIEGSHFGAYQKRYFEIVRETVHENNEIAQESNKLVHEINKVENVAIELQPNKVYRARLYRNPKGYNRQFGIYYVTSTAPPYYHPENCIFYKDPGLTQLCGRFRVEWFTDFEEVTEQTQKEIIVEAVELPKDEWEQLQLF